MTNFQKLVYLIAGAASVMLALWASSLETTGAMQEAVQGIYLANSFVIPYVLARLLAGLLAPNPRSNTQNLSLAELKRLNSLVERMIPQGSRN